MIDIHSHIINEIDDGSKNIEMTINMLKKAEQSGTTDIIATPHFMRGRFEVEYKEVIEKVEGEKGWQMRGSITVDGKYYDLYLSGSRLEVGDTTYRIKQEEFLAEFKAIFDEIKNPK